jgi:hypothetical protein
MNTIEEQVKKKQKYISEQQDLLESLQEQLSNIRKLNDGAMNVVNASLPMMQKLLDAIDISVIICDKYNTTSNGKCDALVVKLLFEHKTAKKD